MWTKIAGISIILAIGAFYVNRHVKEQSALEAKKAERLRFAQERKSALSQILLQYNARTDWEDELSKGEKCRTSPIITVELERLWLGDRPILFLASVTDISSMDSDDYQILLEENYFNMKYIFATEFRLSLRTSKAMLDGFLRTHSQLFSDSGFNNGVAVIAKIEHISSSDYRDRDGERVEVKIGHGELLEIVYTGNVVF